MTKDRPGYPIGWAVGPKMGRPNPRFKYIDVTPPDWPSYTVRVIEVGVPTKRRNTSK
jgi:hypothetical protein